MQQCQQHVVDIVFRLLKSELNCLPVFNINDINYFDHLFTVTGPPAAKYRTHAFSFPSNTYEFSVSCI